MDTAEFIDSIPDFEAKSPREQIRLLAWHLHVNRGVEVITYAAVRDCFRSANFDAPDVTVYMPRMAGKSSQELIRTRSGFKLAGSVRRLLDSKYGGNPRKVLVSKLLADLPTAIPNLAEKTFLQEAIACYRVGAYRAAIVMTWNLAFDHLVAWLLADAIRLSAFNSAIPKRYPKRTGLLMTSREGFEELKESEVIEVCGTGDLFSKSTVNVLREKLKRRNIAAHPSQVIITQSQADDAITDLVNNVVLALR